MERSDVMSKSNSESTFVVKIKYQENSTWQGSVNWVNGNTEKPFRSALELIKLIDSAVSGDIEIIEKDESK